MAEQATALSLPDPVVADGTGLNAVLRQRRTVRAFAPDPLTLTQVSQLLWAAQGITSPEGYRTAPSAGALYPLELHLLSGRVENLPEGSYRYEPSRHALLPEAADDLRRGIAAAALQQSWIAEAPAIVVISAVEARTAAKYGRRAKRYVHMEAGHAGQNLLLQAVALGLGAAVVGAFDDDRLAALLQLPRGERPLAILPVGHAR